nr:hypothetical protein C2845_PM10G05490 [Ipomoea batatas]
MQKLRCRVNASSPLISRSSHRRLSSFTASAHKPQIHFPWYRSRILSMYARVHSSINPQQSHFAKSTSIAAVVNFVVTVSAIAAVFTTIESLIHRGELIHTSPHSPSSTLASSGTEKVAMKLNKYVREKSSNSELKQNENKIGFDGVCEAAEMEFAG